MKINGIELSHQNASLAVREAVSLSNEQVYQHLVDLGEQLDEVVVINTCNRLSVYTFGNKVDPAFQFFEKLGKVEEYIQHYEEDIAIHKLFSTTAGLESQAIGEHQILGQVKSSFLLAQEHNTVGPVLNNLFRSAIHLGRRVRGETSIGQYTTSLAAVAKDLIYDKFHDLTGKSILIIGTGEMAQLTLKNVVKIPVDQIYISSNSLDRAKEVASVFDVQAISHDHIDSILENVDIIIGATEAKQPILNKVDIEKFKQFKLLIDLGLPRNFHEDIKRCDAVKLYDLDDIKFFTQLNFQKRQKEIPKAQQIIQEEIKDFKEWLGVKRNAAPMIASYWNQLENIKEEELNWLLPKLGDLDDQQKKVIERMLHRLIRKVSKNPIEQMKQYANREALLETPTETIKKMFNISK